MSKRYSISFVKSARQEFLRLPRAIQDRVLEALSFLAENPFSQLLQIKKLKGRDKLFRIRIADYRVVYTVQSEKLIVIIVKVGHRREIYR